MTDHIFPSWKLNIWWGGGVCYETISSGIWIFLHILPHFHIFYFSFTSVWSTLLIPLLLDYQCLFHFDLTLDFSNNFQWGPLSFHTALLCFYGQFHVLCSDQFKVFIPACTSRYAVLVILQFGSSAWKRSTCTSINVVLHVNPVDGSDALTRLREPPV